MTPIHKCQLGNKTLLLVVVIYLFGATAASKATSLSFAFTLGGTQYDVVRAVSTDASRNIYIVGETYSNDFPGANASVTRSSGDAFVVKLNGAGTQILYIVILGGSNYDSARAVAVDSSGNAYITGVTNSTAFRRPTMHFKSGRPARESRTPSWRK
jgi:hypothetical protein